MTQENILEPVLKNKVKNPLTSDTEKFDEIETS